MSEPTKESLEEAKALYAECCLERLAQEIGLMLDKIHDRKPPVDPIEKLWDQLLYAYNPDNPGPGPIEVLRKAIEDATRPADDDALWAANPGWISSEPFVKRLRSIGFQIIRSPAPEVMPIRPENKARYPKDCPAWPNVQGETEAEAEAIAIAAWNRRTLDAGAVEKVAIRIGQALFDRQGGEFDQAELIWRACYGGNWIDFRLEPLAIAALRLTVGEGE